MVGGFRVSFLVTGGQGGWVQVLWFRVAVWGLELGFRV